MANILTNETAIKTAMLWLDSKGAKVSWSGLCVWAEFGKEVKEGSALSKDLETIGAVYSKKRNAYYLRADDTKVLPKKKSLTIEGIKNEEVAA